jgi:hypothetical protein
VLTIKFSCKLCCLTSAPVAVRGREPNQSLPNWLEGVKRQVARRHKELSPDCANAVVDLKLPIPAGSEYAGHDPAGSNSLTTVKQPAIDPAQYKPTATVYNCLCRGEQCRQQYQHKDDLDQLAYCPFCGKQQMPLVVDKTQ